MGDSRYSIIEKRLAYHLITIPGVGDKLSRHPSPFDADLVVTAVMDFLANWGSRLHVAS